MRPGWGYPPPPGWGSRPPAWPGRRGGGVLALVLVTLAVLLAAPHARALRPQVKALRGILAGQLPDLPAIRLPRLEPSPPASRPARPPRGLTFTSSAGCEPARDWRSPQLDRRVRALLAATARQQRIRVSCLRTGHSRFVRGTTRTSNHTVWRAVDIDRVDGRAVGPANLAARQLAGWIGRGGAGVHPSEVGSPWDFGGRPWFTDGDHQGHIHVGFAGPTRPGGAG
jgi:hypothetical protein